MIIKPLPVGRDLIEYAATFNFDASELTDEPLDLPHSRTIVLYGVKPEPGAQP